MFNGVPVWNLNDAAGADRATGCVMWVGCDVPIKGHLPQHFVSWDQNLAWTARVDALISWYKHPERPINFGILYIEEPDETGHRFGPDSPELAATVQKMDQLTGKSSKFKLCLFFALYIFYLFSVFDVETVHGESSRSNEHHIHR